MDNALKILHVSAGLFEHTGGPAETVPGLIKALNNRGHSMTLLTYEGNLSLSVRDLVKDGVNIETVRGSNSGIWWSFQLFRTMPRYVRTSDIIHIHGLWLFSTWYGYFLSKCFSKPIIICPRGSLDPVRLEKSYLKKRISSFLFEKRMIRNAAAIHCTSIDEIFWVKKFSPTSNTILIENGIYCEPEVNLDSIKPTKRIIYVSRINPTKGLDILLSAWKESFSSNNNIMLEIYGPDEEGYSNYVKTHLEEIPNANYYGPIYNREKIELFKNSSLFVLPSYSENFGIVVGEAMAYGLLTLTTSNTYWKDNEVLKRGIICDANKQSLKAALSRALSLENNTSKIYRKNAHKFVYEELSWNKISQKAEHEYFKILKY